MSREHKVITVSSYGLFCLSPDIFDRFLKTNKIKTGKLNKYFDKHRDILEQSMLEGSWIPVSTINSIDYLVDVGFDSYAFTNDWQEVISLPGCNLTVGTDGVWIGSTGSINKWNINSFTDQNSISYQTMDGETLYNAHRFDIDEGTYKANFKGFKKREKEPYPAVNFGFYIELQQTNLSSDFTNPLTYDVNIARM